MPVKHVSQTWLLAVNQNLRRLMSRNVATTTCLFHFILWNEKGAHFSIQKGVLESLWLIRKAVEAHNSAEL